MELLRTTLGNRDLSRIEVAWATATLGNWAFSILLALYACAASGSCAGRPCSPPCRSRCRRTSRFASASGATGPVSLLVIGREEFLAAVGGHPRSAHAAETVALERLDVNPGARPQLGR